MFGNKRATAPPTSGFGNSSWTRATATSAIAEDVPYTAEAILSDLTPSDQPIWLLSSYTAHPIRFEGLEESTEELRVKYAIAVKAGTLNDYFRYEANAMGAAERKREEARAYFHQAYEHVLRISVQRSSTSASSNIPTSSTIVLPPRSEAPDICRLNGWQRSARRTPNEDHPSWWRGAGDERVLRRPNESASVQTQGAYEYFSPNPPISVFGSAPATTSAFGSATPILTSAFGQPALGQPVGASLAAFDGAMPMQPQTLAQLAFRAQRTAALERFIWSFSEQGGRALGASAASFDDLELETPMLPDISNELADPYMMANYQ